MIEYKIGTKFVSPNGETYMLSRVNSASFALICLSTGNRWSNPITVASSFCKDTLKESDVLSLMNDSYYKEDKVWDVVGAASKIAFPKEAVTKKKPDVVQVTRYFRPLNNQGSQVDSLRGLTADYLINYVTGTIIIKWSICNGDNFNKELGCQLARLNGKKAVVGQYIKNKSLFHNLYKIVMDDTTSHDKNLVSMLIEIQHTRNFLGDKV